MSDLLPAALLELLAAGPATPTQLQQRLQDAGAPIHYEVIVAALRELIGSGFVQRFANCTFALAPSVTRPQDTERPPAVPARETDVTKIECQRCGESKAPDEMIQRNGKPSRTCKGCFSAAHLKRGGKAAKGPAKAAAKSAAPASKSAPGSRLVVDRRVRVELVDADGTPHEFALTAEQAEELREALA